VGGQDALNPKKKRKGGKVHVRMFWGEQMKGLKEHRRATPTATGETRKKRILRGPCPTKLKPPTYGKDKRSTKGWFRGQEKERRFM